MPFAGQDSWRKHPLLSGLWRDPFPGLRPAIFAFAAFCTFEYGWKKMTAIQYAPKSHGHEDKKHQFEKGEIDEVPTRKEH
ncbi:hypothetical protein TrVE_jg13671 [Triparma verrucosa]|uniref:Uncharacterized protein n=2 Tax=Triparma TaxID=722752 RepID=A0A9W7EI84_9STRA|nr:hypothetical protein TrST_g7890 [Triparma strigata]GMH96048.1 hypothetical protein TrVE_jg13671 [Triparma verrucosa]|mmetsp:Transcript_10031/g.18184  ORF Transcript_10031/g.18184 Transcript_10031/m.18184 type:complete len:80 (+) Transcript_10031:40-279(+)